jgi:hypothetical protein
MIMRSSNRVQFGHRRKHLRLKLVAILFVGGLTSAYGYGQTAEYPYQAGYPLPANQAPTNPSPTYPASAYPVPAYNTSGYPSPAYPNPSPVPQFAQNPYQQQQQNTFQLPPPLPVNNGSQIASSGYPASSTESNENAFQFAPVPPSNQESESIQAAPVNRQAGRETYESQEPTSELVVADNLGPAVEEENWIHGSWRSFCQSGCIAGVEGTFLSIQTDSLRSIAATDLLKDQLLLKTPEDGFGAGYRTWAGMQSGAIGFRITYWTFENSFYEPSPNFVPWNSFAFYDSNMLRAQTLDVEFLQRFCFHQSWIETTLGARYASLDRSGLLQGAGELGEVNLLGSSATNSELEGWGGVASIGGWIPVFCQENLAPGCYHPWAFFWKCQGAALQAESKVQAITLANAIPGNDKFSSAYSRDEAIADWEGMIGIGTVQAGLDYRCPVTWIDCNPASIHLRGGFEGQYWQTGDIGVRSQSAATLTGDFNGNEFAGAVISRADTNPEDLVLLGFFLSASLSY